MIRCRRFLDVMLTMMLQSLPVMSLSEADEESSDIVLMTTGLSRQDKDDVIRCVNALGWTQVEDFTTQGTLSPSLCQLHFTCHA